MPSSPASREGSAGEPTILRRIVGAELRRLREARGVTREEAGFEIRSSESKISRVELGRVSFKLRDVEDLLTLYGLPSDDPERERIVTLAKQANAPAWWRRYGDLVPSWFEGYIGLESAAETIRTYEAQLIPGLLQTREYVRAVVRSVDQRASEAEIARKVELRMDRQRQVLERNPPPTVWAVVDEGALRRGIGGPPVMRGQLEALAEAARRPNISIQILPFDAGAHPALTGAFTILRFPEADVSDVVYLELITRALYLDRQDEIDAYTEAMTRLCLAAHQPGQTEDIIGALLKDLPD